MPDTFNLDIDYFDHPKVRRLIGILGPGSEVHHIRLMAYTAKHKPGSGGFDDWSAEEIESAADWRGEKSKMVEALIRCGLLHEKNCGYYLHDWKERQPHLVKYEKTKRERKKAAESRWSKEKKLKKQRNTIKDNEIRQDANDDAKVDFAYPENGFCITSAVQCSAVNTNNTHPRARARDGCELDSFETIFSANYESVVAMAREESKKARRGFALDPSTKEGLRAITLSINRGEVTLDKMRRVVAKVLTDPDRKKWGWRGIAANYGTLLDPDPAPLDKQVNPIPKWREPVPEEVRKHVAEEVSGIVRKLRQKNCERVTE